MTWLTENHAQPWYHQLQTAKIGMLSIDPGDVHCGMAFWSDETCVHTQEMTQSECLLAVRGCLENGLINELVIEKFVLYPWKAEQQAMSQLHTSQLIGGIKATYGWFALPNCTIHEQPASIKTPTRKIANARKYKSTARRQQTGGHCLDAEIHGYFRIWKGRADQ